MCQITRTLTLKKRFSTLRSDCARLREHRILKRVLSQLTFIIKKRRLDVLRLFARFYALSVLRHSLSKSKNREICDINCTLFLIVRVLVNWQMLKLQFMIEKPRPDVLTLSQTFYDLSVSCNLFLKTAMRKFGAAGTEGSSGIFSPEFCWDCMKNHLFFPLLQ